jgi:two-component system OmpR family sensor kinase
VNVFRTLHGKLSSVLFVLLVAFGVVSLVLALRGVRLFLNEMNQTVGLPVAERVAAQRTLFTAGKVNDTAAKELFSTAMAINPLAELYLLDSAGQIVAFSAPADKVKRRSVALAPIQAVLAGAKSPVLGDDPRHETRRKVFSVAVLNGTGPRTAADGAPQGYLYVILGGEQFDSVVQMLARSHLLQWGLWMAAASLGLAAVTGVYVLALLTRPVRQLTAAVERFESTHQPPALPILLARRRPDELDRLASAFERMTRQIADYISRITRSDAQRRELVENVSHDLRTPLAAVQGYVDTLLMKDASLTSDERRHYLELAAGQTRRIDRLATDLFELATLETAQTELRKEPFSACDLLQDVVQKFESVASSGGVALHARFDDDLPLVRGDVRLIERLLDNLLDNALRHTPRGREVTVSCEHQDGDLAIRVSDTGPGIHPDDVPHIFERFYRGRGLEDQTGAGLGLAISQRIAELHGAVLSVEHNGPEGVTFLFRLPTH